MSAPYERDYIIDAYLQMAKTIHYRPAAPSDGLGNIKSSDNKRLITLEAAKYADSFIADIDNRTFFIGAPDLSSKRAFVYTIEAARLLCTGGESNSIALELLRMARYEIHHGACAERSCATDLDSPLRFYELEEHARSLLLDWIHNHLMHSSPDDPAMDSYTLKHIFENHYHQSVYVCNGAFKGAMVHAGYLPITEDKQNWQFRVVLWSDSTERNAL